MVFASAVKFKHSDQSKEWVSGQTPSHTGAIALQHRFPMFRGKDLFDLSKSEMTVKVADDSELEG